MSTALTQLVPVLTSVNWQDWAPLYLMAQGQWYTIVEMCPELSTEPDNSGAVNDWNADNAAATGNIRLRLAPAVRVKASRASSASYLFSALKAEYGKPGIATTYAEFKSLLDITIPSNSHPGPAMDKVQAHFARLKDVKFEISGKVQAMILMAKLPPTMEVIAQMMNQSSRDDKELEKISIANKLSAVKCKQPDPKFRNQQQRPQNEGSSQRRNQRERARLGVRDDFHFSNVIHTSGPVPTVDPCLVAHKTASLQLRPPAWPVTKQAIDLARRISIEPSFEGVCTLETIVADTAGPSKRPRLKEHIVSCGPSPVPSEDVLSLGDDLGEEIANTAGIFPDTMDIIDLYFDDHEDELFSTMRQVNSPHVHHYNADAFATYFDAQTPVVSECPVVNMGINRLCVHSIEYALCADCKGKSVEQDEISPWLLDSGASLHFTFELNDFVDYGPLDPDKSDFVITATTTATISGKGTVLIQVPMPNGSTKSVCLYPVHYIPRMNGQLLSLGTLLHDDLEVTGDKHHIVVHKKFKEFLTFRPRIPGSTLYILRSLCITPNVANSIATIFNVDYNILHRRLVHPGKEVLQ
ncbi:hypothetical protein HYDPIDRAFT_34142 [Hydnomerulius pinastri MD-312]|uniref:Retrovirus-related Pol polyprotein from transposon TNT 1-94-like beta-barrel domain-containing protein n=1 Tax=Hydnomerulius pinastri MD-312 TaxID=994086 RepID=A0A0C9W6Q9_9AGAM|nr:hypothetical protein HYDPIDRAFT_34142 [Hydnomerulius pinastri MD-312]